MNRNLTLTLSSFALATLLNTPLQAQTPTTTFGELESNRTLKEKQQIEITEDNGVKYKARIFAISAQTITVTAKGVQRSLTESQVLQIRRARPDRLTNGIVLGAVTGLGFGLAGTAAICGNDNECAANTGAVLVPMYSGIGAGIGMLLDSLIQKQETVFDRSRSANHRGLHLAPIVAKKTAGVHVSYAF
jgi:hypothetical protein